MSDVDPLYPQYKKARNRIRKCEPLSLAAQLIDCLHEAHVGGIEVIKTHQPCHILLALKWTFQEMDGTCHRRPMAIRNDAHFVLNVLHESPVLPSSFSHTTLFLRQLAFQQFGISQPPDGSALARQEILFGGLAANHLFSRQFLEITGVTISEYLDLTFSVMALLLTEDNRRHIRRSDFNNLEPSIDSKKIDSFLAHLSRTPTQLHAWLSEPTIKDVAVADQLVLTSPFNTAPFLRTGNLLTAYYLPQVYRALEQAIYRPLRTINPAAFGGVFGPMFEGYVGDVMADAGLKFENESGLKAKLPSNGMVVDFLIVDDGCNILIDAKGVEMSTTGRTATTARTLYSTSKRSAMKAIEQGMETLARIRTLPATPPWGTRDTFLIVVTFESLYLGASSDFGKIFDDSLGVDLQKKFGLPFPFPLENVFFMSIREFEDLLARVRAGKGTILQTLRTAKARDADPKTRRFEFAQHLMAEGEASERLPLIKAGLTRLHQRCARRLTSTHGPAGTATPGPEYRS